MRENNFGGSAMNLTAPGESGDHEQTNSSTDNDNVHGATVTDNKPNTTVHSRSPFYSINNTPITTHCPSLSTYITCFRYIQIKINKIKHLL